jgi:DNA-damage-inducible protein J
MKADFVRARIEPSLKQEVNYVLHKIGVTPTQVITMLYQQIKLRRGLPFDSHIPNDETEKVIKEARSNKNLIASKNAEDIFKKLGL